jgi:ATP-dependent protease ClpP protease subunit
MSTNTVKIYAAESRVIDIYLNRDIEDPEKHLPEMMAIREAGPNDIINLYVNGNGGWVTTGIQILSCLADSEAHIVAHLEGNCFSCHTFLFLCADEWVVSPYASFMAHNYSGGAVGKGVEILQQAEAQHARCIKLMKDSYKGFLTDEEITQVVENNRDYWFDSDEITARLENLIKYRNELEEQQELLNKEEVRKHLEEYVDK